MTRERFEATARELGIGFEYATESARGFVLCGVSEESMTFDVLARLSEAFGTRDINIGIERGCASDPTCSPEIYVNLR